MKKPVSLIAAATLLFACGSSKNEDGGVPDGAVSSGDSAVAIDSAAPDLAIVPPANLVYPGAPFAYLVDTAVAPVTPTHEGGDVTSYSVAPALPAGLVIDATSGVLSGTPTAKTAAADYLVTATGSGGSTSATVRIIVLEAPLRVFVSTATALGNFGGAAIGQTICSTDPNKPAAVTFKALLDDPASVLVANTSYFRNGAQIFHTGPDHKISGVDNAIGNDGQHWWTGLAADQSPSADNCSNWGSNSGSDHGARGVKSTVLADFVHTDTDTCDHQSYFICVEQP